MKRKKYRSPLISFGDLNDGGDVVIEVGGSEQGGMDPFPGSDTGSGSSSDDPVVTWDENDDAIVEAINEGLTDLNGDYVIDINDWEIFISGE
jgi:hypothetical protein